MILTNTCHKQIISYSKFIFAQKIAHTHTRVYVGIHLGLTVFARLSCPLIQNSQANKKREFGSQNVNTEKPLFFALRSLYDIFSCTKD